MRHAALLAVDVSRDPHARLDPDPARMFAIEAFVAVAGEMRETAARHVALVARALAP